MNNLDIENFIQNVEKDFYEKVENFGGMEKSLDDAVYQLLQNNIEEDKIKKFCKKIFDKYIVKNKEGEIRLFEDVFIRSKMYLTNNVIKASRLSPLNKFWLKYLKLKKYNKYSKNLIKKENSLIINTRIASYTIVVALSIKNHYTYLKNLESILLPKGINLNVFDYEDFSKKINNRSVTENIKIFSIEVENGDKDLADIVFEVLDKHFISNFDNFFVINDMLVNKKYQEVVQEIKEKMLEQKITPKNNRIKSKI